MRKRIGEVIIGMGGRIKMRQTLTTYSLLLLYFCKSLYDFTFLLVLCLSHSVGQIRNRMLIDPGFVLARSDNFKRWLIFNVC